MQIEGTIEEVMESWPLQLHVRSADAVYHAELTDAVSAETQSRLVPGMRVQLVCDAPPPPHEPSAVIANDVIILGGDAGAGADL